jgi:hypothetical protein
MKRWLYTSGLPVNFGKWNRISVNYKDEAIFVFGNSSTQNNICAAALSLDNLPIRNKASEKETKLFDLVLNINLH